MQGALPLLASVTIPLKVRFNNHADNFRQEIFQSQLVLVNTEKEDNLGKLLFILDFQFFICLSNVKVITKIECDYRFIGTKNGRLYLGWRWTKQEHFLPTVLCRFPSLSIYFV
jgi:hypothetical protein